MLHSIFTFTLEYSLVILDQRKRKLESLEKEDDLRTLMAKLIDQAANYNIQRFHCAMDVKVKSLSGSGFCPLLVIMLCCDFVCWFMSVLRNKLSLV